MQRLGLRLASASTRATSSVPRFAASHGTRKLHERKVLTYPVEEGLGSFLPPDALKVQLEWQDGLLERLNDEVARMLSFCFLVALVLIYLVIDTGEASSTIVQTVINLSGNKSKILAFNCASLALNNDFFLQNLVRRLSTTLSVSSSCVHRNPPLLAIRHTNTKSHQP